MECKEQKIKSVIILNISDIKKIKTENDIITGIVIKRKYGKNKRQIIKHDLFS